MHRTVAVLILLSLLITMVESALTAPACTSTQPEGTLFASDSSALSDVAFFDTNGDGAEDMVFAQIDSARVGNIWLMENTNRVGQTSGLFASPRPIDPELQQVLQQLALPNMMEEVTGYCTGYLDASLGVDPNRRVDFVLMGRFVVRVCQTSPTGSFTCSTLDASAFSSHAIPDERFTKCVVGDFNGDSYGDVIFFSRFDGIFVARGGPGKTLGAVESEQDWAAIDLSRDPGGLRLPAPLVFDVNRDDKPDILFVEPRGNVVWAVGNETGIGSPINETSFVFVPKVLASFPERFFRFATAGHLNDDDTMDVVTIVRYGFLRSSIVWYPSVPGDPLAVVPGIEVIELAGFGTIGLAIGDVDGDGALDLVFPDGGASTFLFARNGVSGNASFDAPPRLLSPVCPSCNFATVVDVNGDSRLDLLATSTLTAKVLGTIQRSFTSLTRATFVGQAVRFPTSLTVVDWNNDRGADVLVSAEDPSRLLSLHLTNTPGFPSASTLVLLEQAHLPGARGVLDVTALDTNGDAVVDVMVLVDYGADTPRRVFGFVQAMGALELESELTLPAGVNVSSLTSIGLRQSSPPGVLLLSYEGTVLYADPVGGAGVEVVFNASEYLANTSSVEVQGVLAEPVLVAPRPVPTCALLDVESSVTRVVCASLMGRGELMLLTRGQEAASQLWVPTLVTGLPLSTARGGGLGAESLVVADLTEDGVVDVGVASREGVGLYVGSGSGGFTPVAVSLVPSASGEEVGALFAGQLDARPGPDLSGGVARSFDGGSTFVLPTWSWNGTGMAPAMAPYLAAAPDDAVEESTRQLGRSDLNLDGVADLLSMDGNGRPLWKAAHAVFGSVFPPPSRVLVVDVARHGYTVYGVLQTVLQTSACVVDTVLVPPGTYTGCPKEQYGISWSVTLKGAGEQVVFDCEGSGVLFAVSGGAELGVEGIELRNLGSTLSLTSGSMGLFVTGTGSVLRLRNVTVVNALAASPTGVYNDATAGFGGAVLGTEGASVVVEHCVFEGNRAGRSGGAIALLGLGVTLRLSGSRFEGNVALDGSGGAVFVEGERLGELAVVVSNVSLVGNSAVGGNGGGLVLEHRLGLEACVEPKVAVGLEDVRVVGNGADGDGGGLSVGGACMQVNASALVVTSNVAGGRGGGVGVEGEGEGVELVLVDASVVGRNNASYGGGFYVCGANVTVMVGLNESDWRGGRAKVAGAGWFACGGGGVELRVEDLPGLRLMRGGEEEGVGVGSLEDVFGGGGGVGGVGGPLYGPLAGTPPVEILPGPELRDVRLVAGGVLPAGIAYSLVDAFGQAVVDGEIRLGMVDGGDGGSVLLFGASGTEVAVLDPDTGLASFEGTLVRSVVGALGPVAASGDPSMGLTASASVFLVGLDGGGEEGGGASTGSLEVTVFACPPGSGSEVGTGAGTGAGTGTGADEVVACALCGPGTFAPSVGVEPCLPCVGYSAAQGAVACTTCTRGSVPQVEGVPENSTEVPCVCEPEYYALVGRETGAPICEECPPNGVCRGGLDWPSALPGFFDVSAVPGTDKPEFSQCRIPSSCSGGNGCKTGYTGYMCGTCEREYYVNSAGECVACPDASGLLFGLAIVVVIGLCIGAVFVLGFTTRMSGRGSSTMLQRHMSRIPYTLSMALLFCQLASTFGESLYLWPETASSTLQALSFSNVDTTWFANSCSVASYGAQYAMLLLFPLVVVGMFSVALFAYVTFFPGGSHLTFGQGLQTALITGGPLVYFPLVRGSLRHFDCVKLPSGDYVLDGALSEPCFAGTWWGLLPLAVFGLVVYVIGIPAGVGGLLWRSRDSLSDPSVLAILGPMYRRYRAKMYWWEVVGLFRRLCIGVATLFFSHAQVLQLMSVFLVLGMWTVLVLKWRPYFLDVHMRLELQLNMALIAILTAGFIFYGKVFPSSGVRTFLIVFVVAIVVVAFICIVVATVEEAKLLVMVARNPNAERGRSIPERKIRSWLVRDLPDWEDGSGFRAKLESWVVGGGGGGGGGDLGGVEMMDV